MKKIILTLALIVSLACANTASALGFDWGVTGGLNLSKLSLNDSYKQFVKSDNQAGWFLGLKANASIALGFGVDASLIYSQQRLSIETTTGNVDATHKTLRSISIPVNLRYNIGVGSVASVYIATGPQFDFNIGSRKWDDLVVSTISAGNESAFKSESMTTSWNVGAGVKLLDRVEIGVGYNFGLGKVAKSIVEETTGMSITNDDMKSNVFKVSATVYF